MARRASKSRTSSSGRSSSSGSRRHPLSRWPSVDDYPRYDLTGQVALVTGAARRLGSSIALALAHARADVALGPRHADTPRTVPAADVAVDGRPLAVQVDVTTQGQMPA